ncbi:MAG: hypothetical protein GF387_02565 [Candidatus Portnoybacteria bacterium]|nr:hypothetical protein [Candidatus Portnoybacteria bacterium]
MNNTYYIIRHGEAESNRDQFCSSWPEKVTNPITEKGEKKIKKQAKKLKKENIDIIFSSPLLRTKQTAEIIAEELNLKISLDERIREHDCGIFNGRTVEEWNNFFKTKKEKFTKRPPNGENRRDIKERLESFLKETEEKYNNKNILIVSHEGVLLIFQGIIKNLSEEEMANNEKLKLKPGECRKI